MVCLCSLFMKLPEELWIEKIYPYTYKPQPKLLLEDIRSFPKEFYFVENMYLYYFNYRILFNDLIEFCMENTFLSLRFTLIQIETFSDLYTFRTKKNMKRKSRILFALLNPLERKEFIRKQTDPYSIGYIIDDSTMVE